MKGDRLFLSGLEVDCIIGCAEWERMVRQTVRIDLVVRYDLQRLARADRLVEGGLDSRALSKRIQEYVGGTRFQLLETLAEELCGVILREFPVERLRLRLSKPGALRGARNVGVILERP